MELDPGDIKMMEIAVYRNIQNFQSKVCQIQIFQLCVGKQVRAIFICVPARLSQRIHKRITFSLSRSL
ncbi:MAG: hypothetical protein PUK81_03455 [Firmicutes bacterium]|nr:hypothetical protein [Bacillota bacterium]